MGKLWTVCGIYGAIVASNLLLFITHASVLVQRIS